MGAARGGGFLTSKLVQIFGAGEEEIDQGDASGEKTAGGKEQIESKNKEIER